MTELIVHHIPETRSERVIWLLEELEVPYRTDRLSYRGGDFRGPEFLKINPFGMVPAISHGALHLRETGAIFAYLFNLFGHQLEVTDEDKGYTDYLQWLHSAEATLFQPLVGYIMHTQVLSESERIPRYAEVSLAAWERFAAILDAHLKSRSFVAGERFSAADILVGHVLRMARLAEAPVPKGCGDYLDRLSARPAFQTMLQR